MKHTAEEMLREALAAWSWPATVTEAARYGNGHINDTFLGTTEEGALYIIQRINTDIFTDPDGLMNNIKLVTDHIRNKVASRGGDTSREVMTIVPTLDGKLYYTDINGSAWRVYDFVTDSLSLDRPRNTDDSYLAIKAFGEFASSLADFDASLLVESIKDFHNTPKRYSALINAITANVYGRAEKVGDEIKFAQAHESFTRKLVTSGLPLRVTHNDTKLSNVLLDDETGEAVCVIDLDTVMPGTVLYDFGDAIRFGASTAAEDEPDTSKIALDMDLFKAFTRGFISEVKGSLTETELRMLPLGIKVITCELAMRFLTDYIDGDLYFKVRSPEHNLIRARAQMKLAADMQNKFDDMNRIVAQVAAQVRK